MPTPCVKGVGPSQATIMIVGAAATADDLWKGYPFAGNAGNEFAKMLHEAGIVMSECYRTYVVKSRAPGDRPNDLFTQNKSEASKKGLTSVIFETYTTSEMAAHLLALEAEIDQVKPTVIIAIGDLAMWALTGVYGSVDTWRGSHLEYNRKVAWGTPPTVIPTYEPQWIWRMWHVRGFAVRDLQRARDVAARPDLYRWPDYQFITRPSFQQVMAGLHQLLLQCEQTPEGVYLSTDVETIARHLSCVGIAWNVREALCIPLMTLGGHYWTEDEEVSILVTLRELLTHPNARVIGQNFNYDNQHFAKHLGFLPNLAEDTMIAQHALFPGIPKSLDFLSSMYCHYHRYWKDEMDDYSRLPENMEQYWTYNCLSGDTPVLDAFCHWKPLSSVQLGDDLLTFEEVAGNKGTRKLIHATVTNKASAFKEAVRVTFTDGSWLDGTPDHRVVSQEKVKYRKQAFAAPIWKTLEELQPGDALPHVPPWKRSYEYEDGWVAGLVDGEGTLGHHSQANYKSMLISVAQKEGLVAERFRRGLRRHGFTWNEQDKHGVVYFGIRGGLSEQLRFLGIFEADRLQCTMLDIAMEQGFGGSQQLPKKIVKEVTPIGRIEVFDITTTAGTFLTSSGIAHNCKDVVVTFECWLVLKELLTHLNKWEQYAFLMDVGRSALKTMLRGIAINQKARSAVAGQLMAAIAEYDQLIHDIAGFQLNVDSPKQMMDFFYGQLKLPIQIDRKTKRPTCSSPALLKISEKEPLIKPLVELIEKRRSMGVFLSTFCLMALDEDGRMRCTFNVCGTETFRFSSSKNAFGSGGNLQNIPRGEEGQ